MKTTLIRLEALGIQLGYWLVSLALFYTEDSEVVEYPIPV